MFQVRGFSCRIGHAKPDPAAFRWCLDALAVPADQVVFVDDREENIQAARAIGMRCHLFTTPHAFANSWPLEPSSPVLPPDAAGYLGGKGIPDASRHPRPPADAVTPEG